jgi:hypothetical protein
MFHPNSPRRLGTQFLLHPFFETAAGGASSTQQPAPAPGSTEQNRQQRQVDTVLAQYSGDAARIAADLVQSERTVTQLQAAVTRLEARQIPEGGVALTPDQRKEWEAFTALGKSAADVKAALETADKNAERLKELELEVNFAKIEEITGISAAALRKLAPDLEIEFGGTDDKPEAFVKDKDGQRKKLDAEYVSATWPEFKASLLPAEGTKTGKEVNNEAGTTRTQERRFVRQAGAGDSKKTVTGDGVTRVIGKYEVPTFGRQGANKQ